MARDSTIAAAAVGALLSLLACSGKTLSIGDAGIDAGSGSSSGAFPFSGPSCSPGEINTGCWQCTVNQCNGGCVTGDCASFFQCFCMCPAGDMQCQNGCTNQLDATCQQCLSGINSCENGSCKSACPTKSTACSSTACANGGSMEMCTVSSGGTCTAAYYQVGSQQFACASCTDTSACQMAAQQACK